MLQFCGRKVNLSAACRVVCGVGAYPAQLCLHLETRRLMQANQLIGFPVEAVLCIVILNCSNFLLAHGRGACSNNTALQFAASRHMGRRRLLDDRIGTHSRLTCRCTSVFPGLCQH